MRRHQLIVLSVFFVLAAPLANLAKTLAPPWGDIRVKHSWNAVPHSWETLGHPPAGTTINLHIALKPHHGNALTDALHKVSDPKSPEHVLSNTLLRTAYSHVPLLRCRYGAHLSKEQVAQLVAPHPDTLELIYSWLEYHSVPSSSISTTHGSSWLKLSGVPVSQANEMLGASYQVYRRTGTNDSTILRTIGYALPSVLHEHVRTVVPTTYFASKRTLLQAPRGRSVRETADMMSRTVLSSRNDEISPQEVRWLYRTSSYVPAATDQNWLAVAGYLNDYPSPMDLTAFMRATRADAVGATYRVTLVNGGGNDPSHPSFEANLDMQYTQAIAYPTPHTFYSTGGSMVIIENEPDEGDIWLEWLIHVLSEPTVPQTISTPYADYEIFLPLEYTETLCDLFAELGTRGASVLFSSGNDGVGPGNCIVNDGSGRVQFIPEFPASCPWVTSVGGTTGLDPEVAAPLSGGGFSNHFARPPYQDHDVLNYLYHLGGQYYGMYNPGGRGIPDISAQALRVFFVQNNMGVAADGTSCAVPIVAGIISLLNDYRLSTDRPPLGFLNPWLYSYGFAGIYDITSGSNPGCGTDGFPAIAGWDPVTGLGSPDFLALQYILHIMSQY
ncbi:subtilisin-like protein [Lactarius psammicola]|nr:subtilisin-like protein [Lactarius psammicola]